MLRLLRLNNINTVQRFRITYGKISPAKVKTSDLNSETKYDREGGINHRDTSETFPRTIHCKPEASDLQIKSCQADGNVCGVFQSHDGEYERVR